MNRLQGSLLAGVIGTLTLATTGCTHFGSQAQFPYQAKILLRESLECSAPGHPANKALRCEPSGVTFSRDQIWLVNDKTIGAAPSSSILTSPFQGFKLRSVAEAKRGNPIAIGTKKWEDIDSTPNGEYLIATTGFDRVKPDGSWDVYNRLVAWPTGRFEQLSLVEPNSERHSVKSHIDLKQAISDLLKTHGFTQTNYFKIEGLTATNTHLLLGIREVGLNYEAFSYTITVMTLPYIIDTDGLKIIGPPQLLKTITLDEQGWGLSSLTLGHMTDMLLILVSKEDGEKLTDLNGRLLVTTTAPGDTDYHYVRSPSGSPLEFHRKAEGITLLGGQRYLIIHDDDRRLGEATDGSTRRALKEASYDIIQFFNERSD